jgi:phosphoribosylanthranilate isomerase
LVRIKICGLKEPEHALAAARAGADMLGLVFADSKRRVSPDKARLIAEAVRRLKDPPALVGVFVNEMPSEVNRLAEYCHLDYVQLSGDEDWDYCRRLEYPIIKVIHVSCDSSAESVLDYIEEGLKSCPGLTFMLDTASGAPGGSGVAFDRELARRVAARYPVIIAGGLEAASVGELVRRVCPMGVDVSSGVETNGVKDENKIRDFISAARKADPGEGKQIAA